MSIIEETKSYLSTQRGKLQEERGKLVDERDRITAQIAELDDLLDQLNSVGKQATRQPSRTRAAPTGRRFGIREQVLDVIRSNANIKPADIRTAIGATDKAGSQSVSNALSALKKAEKITQSAQGGYSIAAQ